MWGATALRPASGAMQQVDIERDIRPVATGALCAMSWADPFENLALFLAGQGVKNRPELVTNFPRPQAILGDEHDLVFAMPLRVGQALVTTLVHRKFPVGWAHQATEREHARRPERSKLCGLHPSNRWLTFSDFS